MSDIKCDYCINKSLNYEAGIDVAYFTKNLSIMQRDLAKYTAKELARCFARLALVADEETATITIQRKMIEGIRNESKTNRTNKT